MSPAVSLTAATILLPFFAYSTIYIAENIPIGTAIIIDKNVINIVLIIEGIIETLSDVYVNENKLPVKYGTPLINIYAIKKIQEHLL